jgi:single-strand DNA-binding protein
MLQRIAAEPRRTGALPGGGLTGRGALPGPGRCSIFVLMYPVGPHPDHWPRPPVAIPAAMLTRPPNGARVTVAGLVLVRQRPGTAKGVIFVTLEDETGTANIVVWRKIYERFRRAVIAGRLLRVTGRLERQHGVSHVLAEEVEDLSPMLDALIRPQLDRPGDQP